MYTFHLMPDILHIWLLLLICFLLILMNSHCATIARHLLLWGKDFAVKSSTTFLSLTENRRTEVPQDVVVRRLIELRLSL